MQTFISVMEHGSFAAAARDRGVSRAYVSKIVGDLEQRLEAQLFLRTTRSLSPTQEAQKLYARMVPLLRQWDDVVANVASAGEPRGRIRIAAPRNLGDDALAPVIAQYVKTYPHVEVDLQLQDRRVQLVEEGFDLAIRVAPRRDSTHRYRRLAPCDVHVVASPEYLAKYGTPEHPSDLSKHRAVVDTNLDIQVRWPFVIDGGRRFVEVTPVISVNSPRSTLLMVLNGAGIGLVNTSMTSNLLSSGRLVKLLGDYPVDLHFELHVIYAAGTFLPPRVRLFLDMLVAHDFTLSEPI